MGTITYHSLCGGLVVTRYSHRQMGVHNGRAMPAMAFNVAHAFAQHDMRLHQGWGSASEPLRIA